MLQSSIVSNVPDELSSICGHRVRYHKVRNHYYAVVGEYEVVGHSLQGAYQSLLEEYHESVQGEVA